MCFASNIKRHSMAHFDQFLRSFVKARVAFKIKKYLHFILFLYGVRTQIIFSFFSFLKLFCVFSLKTRSKWLLWQVKPLSLRLIKSLNAQKCISSFFFCNFNIFYNVLKRRKVFFVNKMAKSLLIITEKVQEKMSFYSISI